MGKMIQRGGALGDRLIEEGIRQLKEHGMAGFSARAVAEACGVSCAAPFRHFKGRREFFQAISKHLDNMLLAIMTGIEEHCGNDYKWAHLEMNVAYIHFLVEYGFLINDAFWHIIDENQTGIRKWNSFHKMAGQFVLYCEDKGISREIYKSYYFNFQALAYGAAFSIVNGMILDGLDPFETILDIQERIYKNLELMMGDK